MSAYYNELDPFAAQWLRNLIEAGAIAPGVVDERDIHDVHPKDLDGFTQCHFFAGIGGWSLALRMAGWPDDLPVWTGSPPCQPFSVAGLQRGVADDRHLAPVWLRLVEAGRPAVIFGEQVAAAVKKDHWLDDLLDGLEGQGYSTGAAVLPACGVGAPHIRQRLWFTAARMGDTEHTRLEGFAGHGGCDNQPGWVNPLPSRSASATGAAGGLANGSNNGHPAADGLRAQAQPPRQAGAQGIWQSPGGGDAGGHWDTADWLYCRDSTWRPVEPGAYPLAHGIPNFVGRLRGYGNAIVPQDAAEIIRCVMDEHFS